jgi:hypothetical protein
MELLPWVLLGAVVGIWVGWITPAPWELWRRRRGRDEGGFMASRVRANVALTIVVLVTVWAAIQSQIASDRALSATTAVADAQDQDDRENACTSSVLFAGLGTLGDRADFGAAQSQANIDLQKAQLRFFSALAVQPGPSPEEGRRLFNKYLDALNAFLSAASEAVALNNTQPYPTPQEYAECLKAAREDPGK